MEESRIFIFTILVINLFPLIYSEKIEGTEKTLYRELFQNYSTSPRPTKSANIPVVVKFGVALNQVLDLDEKKQILTSSVWITESWKDEELVWSVSEYDGLDTLIVPSSKLWNPDIFIFNTAGNKIDDFVNVTGGRLVIQNEGHVTWLIPLMIKSVCRVDATFFPYDEQICEIHFGSWIYDETQLDLQPFQTKPGLDDYVVNSEFDLKDASLRREVVDSKCCPGNGNHPMVVLTINLKRKSRYYEYIVIAPTMLLSILSLFSFCLPSHHGDKISIGLTVFLTLYVLQLLISDNVPDTNTTPILGILTFLVMTFNCTSLIMSTLVMNIKNRGKRYPIPEVPPLLSKVCQGFLGKITFSKFSSRVDKFYLCSDKSNQDLNLRTKEYDSGKVHFTEPVIPDKKTPEIEDEILELADLLNEKEPLCPGIPTNSSPESNLKPCNHEDPFRLNRQKLRRSYKLALRKGLVRTERHHHDEDNENNDERNNGDSEDTDNELKIHQQNMLLKQEWYFIAETVERASFIVYVIATFITIMTILVIIPLYTK
ncbi:unnamed protein product [Mytilus coruscus]|uniref:CHRNN n=1 Tax=Mytilus coruscus TaxID=42192 RepID=A0A6J7ZXC8_MYTCO|nr:unnamed protein product [Mytilus coruscus]